MKSFLLRGKKPICKWGMIADNTFYEGDIPEGYSLAVSPSEGYIIVDVDRHGDQNGFKNIPLHLVDELYATFWYETKNSGAHFWFKYTGGVNLANRASDQSIDLRTHKGYVVLYKPGDIREHIKLVNETSKEMNDWLEGLFYYKNKTL